MRLFDAGYTGLFWGALVAREVRKPTSQGRVSKSQFEPKSEPPKDKGVLGPQMKCVCSSRSTFLRMVEFPVSVFDIFYHSSDHVGESISH